LEGNFSQQPFNALQTFIALQGEMKRLAAQLRIMRVEERNHRT